MILHVLVIARHSLALLAATGLVAIVIVHIQRTAAPNHIRILRGKRKARFDRQKRHLHLARLLDAGILAERTVARSAALVALQLGRLILGLAIATVQSAFDARLGMIAAQYPRVGRVRYAATEDFVFGLTRARQWETRSAHFYGRTKRETEFKRAKYKKKWGNPHFCSGTCSIDRTATQRRTA